MNKITMTLQVDHLILEALKEDISSEDVTSQRDAEMRIAGYRCHLCGRVDLFQFGLQKIFRNAG